MVPGSSPGGPTNILYVLTFMREKKISRRKFIYGASCSICSALILPSCAEVPITNRKQLNFYEYNLPIILPSGGIGFYSLGKHRKNMTNQEKKEYLDIFEKYFLKSFSSRLAEYTDPRIRVESQKKLNDKYTMVSSILLATEDKPELKIDWRVVTKDPNNPLIIDVVIEGVSLAKVQKEEFNSIIQSNDGDMNALFKNLKDFVEKK